MKNETCYMCGSAATSREHVPPICLFPESKDGLEYDLRKNLITVPSCDEHNSKKSNDDEFLMISIAGIVGNNELAYYHNLTKINRALQRKGKDFLEKSVIRNAKDFVFDSNGVKFPMIKGKPDTARLNKSFEHIARGLFYHEFKKVFDGECIILFGFVKYQLENVNTVVAFIKANFKLEYVEKEKGDNPEVFKYAFLPADHLGFIGLKLTFFSGTEVFICFKPSGIKVPYDLATDLIRKGIKTVVDLNGENFEFN